MSILNALQWRFATKRMNGQKVPKEKLGIILEAIRLSASSTGLQPYNVLLIEDETLRKQISPIANNQPQILEASHLLVFAAWTSLTEERYKDVSDSIINVRGELNERSKSYLDGAKTRSEKDPESFFSWTARQVYIALGTALVAAAEEKVDSTPMEGFNSKALDELLKLEEKGLKSVVLLPLGYRDENTDWLLNLPKVRRPIDNLVIKL